MHARMHNRMKIGAIAAAAALVPVALAGAAPGTHHATRGHIAPFGVVVDWRAASHTVTVARPSGQLYAIHNRTRVAVGSMVVVRHLTRLRNGTYAGTIVRVGRAREARVRGRVVANLGRRGFALSAVGRRLSSPWGTGASRTGMERLAWGCRWDRPSSRMSITGYCCPSRHDRSVWCAVLGGGSTGLRRSTPAHPSDHRRDDGNPVSYTVDMPTSVDLSTLTIGQEIHVLATPNGDGTYTFAVAPTPLEIEGSISAIDTTASTITVTNTDGGVTMTFVVDIPTSINIGGFNVGDEVQLEVIQNADGTYSLAQSGQLRRGARDNPTSSEGDGSGFGLWSGGGSSSDDPGHRS